MELNELMVAAIFAIILVFVYLLHVIRFFLLEKRTIKRLLNFDTVEEGLKSLGIANEMVKELQKDNDTIYATRMNLICVKKIKQKLIFMGYIESDNDMAVKIIRKPPKFYRAKCPYCRAIFDYEFEDIKARYVKCPCCLEYINTDNGCILVKESEDTE